MFGGAAHNVPVLEKRRVSASKRIAHLSCGKSVDGHHDISQYCLLLFDHRLNFIYLLKFDLKDAQE